MLTLKNYLTNKFFLIAVFILCLFIYKDSNASWWKVLDILKTVSTIANNTHAIYTRHNSKNSYSGSVNRLLSEENNDLRRQIKFYKQSQNENIVDEKEARALHKTAISINNAAKGINISSRCDGVSNEELIIDQLFESIKYHETNSTITCLSKLNTVNFYNKYGHTPLTSASFHGYLDITRLVVRWGGDVYLTGKDGLKRTPLHLAVKNGHRDVAKFLYCKGADLDVRDSRGKTPLDYDRSSYYRNMECY